jgi:hypothetical protein
LCEILISTTKQCYEHKLDQLRRHIKQVEQQQSLHINKLLEERWGHLRYDLPGAAKIPGGILRKNFTE